MRGVVAAPGVAISTAEAYRALGRELTSGPESSNMNSFRALLWNLGSGLTAEAWAALGENDFASFVYESYPKVDRVRRKLRRLGAKPVMLSGSGSSVVGVFGDRNQEEQARRSFREQQVESFYLVSRARYRSLWWRSLMGRLKGKEQWPPRSRYAR